MSGRRIVRVVFAAAFVVACRQIVGIEDSPPFRAVDAGADGDAASACGVPTLAAGACGACLAGSCCDALARCDENPACTDVMRCILACAPGDLACTSGCRARSPYGFGAEAAAVASCESSHCAGACGAACGGYVAPSAACGACTNAKCCAEATACMTQPDCAVLAACERACPQRDDACLTTCEARHRDSVDAGRAFGTCVANGCGDTCIGPEWSCLTEPQPSPPATGPAITITFVLLDYTSGKLVSGLTARACRATDFDCTSPVDSFVTDATGVAPLHIPTSPFVGYVELTNTDYGPILVYLPTLAQDLVSDVTVPTRATFEQLEAVVGSIDPTRGAVLVSVADCAGHAAGGVQLSLSPPAPGVTAFYFANRVPTTAATATADDGYAAGGFLGVPPGPVSIGATVAKNHLAYPPFAAYVRAGAVTFIGDTLAPP